MMRETMNKNVKDETVIPEIDQTNEVISDYNPSEDEQKKINESIRRFKQYSDKRQLWKSAASKDHEYYMLKQWTEEQKDVLTARGQAALIIDRIRPAILQLVAILTASMPKFRTVAVTDDDVKKAQLFTMLIERILYKNDYSQQMKNVIKNTLLYGVGYLYLWHDEYGDNGDEEIRLEDLHPFDVYPDPESRKEDLSDSDRMFTSRLITKERAIVLFPDRKDDILRLLETRDYESRYESQNLHNEEDVILLDEITDEDRTKIRFLEEYQKVKVKYHLVIDALSGDNRELNEEQYQNFIADKEIKKGLENQNITEIIKWKTRIRKRTMLGIMLIGEEILPTAIYPIVPFFYEHDGNPYSIGAVRGVIGLQNEINKRRSLMIAHATATTNAKLIAEKGTFENEETIETEWAKPEALILVSPHGTKSISDRIKEWAPQPLPTALYQLEAEAKHDIEYYLGLFSISQGDPSQVPNTKGATLAIEEYGSRRQNLYDRIIGYSLRRVGKICIDFIQSYYTTQRVIRMCNPEVLESEQMRGIQINWPIYDEFGKEIERLNDMSVGEYDLMVVPGSTLPSNRWALLETYLRLYELNAIDKVELWKKTDIVDREGLLKRFSEIEQLKGQIQQLEQQLKIQSAQLQRETQKRVTADERAELEKSKGRLKAGEVETTKKIIDITSKMEKVATAPLMSEGENYAFTKRKK